MTIEAMNTFLEQARTDDALRGKLASIESNGNEPSEIDVIRVAVESGYDITTSDLHRAAKEFEGELTDDVLDAVSGGGVLTTVDKYNPASWLFYGLGLRKSRPGGPYK